MLRYEADAGAQPHGLGVGGGESQRGKRVEKINLGSRERHSAVLSVGVFGGVLADEDDVLAGPQRVKPAMLNRAGGQGEEFGVRARTDTDGEKSDLHTRLLSRVRFPGYAMW